MAPRLTRERLGLFCGHGTEVLKITLVPDQHDDDVRIRMVTKLLQPPSDIDVCCMFCDIVDKECTDSTTVVTLT